MRTYNERVTSLLPHQYFVFGSNTEGRHGKGAALIARLKFGAIYGQAVGLQGQSYAIVTKNLQSRFHPSISKRKIAEQISRLYDHAENFPLKEFFIAYSVGPTLNGYSADEMAEMFTAHKPPENIVFEKKFAKLVKKYL